MASALAAGAAAVTPAPRRNNVNVARPVKLACLACRASRIRCDGKDPCSCCISRNRQCVYVASRRGGYRVSKKKQQGDQHKHQAATEPTEIIKPDFDHIYFDQAASLVFPGAGLTEIDGLPDLSLDSVIPDGSIDTDYILDSIFGSEAPESSVATNSYSTPISTRSESNAYMPIIRTYESDNDILGAYYVYIHPFLPVLPPPVTDCPTDRPRARSLDASSICNPFRPIFSSTYTPTSPLAYAILAILSLIPPPDDLTPAAPDAIKLRREQAQALATLALDTIEAENDKAQSLTKPSEALTSSPSLISRSQLHPHAPVEIEGVLALCILAVYEYAQRGNISKMRSRAGQALVKAMDLGLHALGELDDDLYKEAKRRAWWMTYYCVLQGSITSSTPLMILIHDPRYTTPFPTLASDSEAWSLLLKSQQIIMLCTQYVIDLDLALSTNSNMAYVHEQMVELEKLIQPIAASADAFALGPPASLSADLYETNVAKALRGMARIKINSARIKVHRYCAFSDIPLFSKKHCDLHATGSALPPNTACTCSSFPFPPANPLKQISSSPLSPPLVSPPLTSPPPTPSRRSNPYPSPSYTTPALTPFPFTSHDSAKICLKSAMAIAAAFKDLPYPNPSGTPRSSALVPPFLSATSLTEAPRTMPSFGCCAMQSAYAMLMLCYRTRALTWGPEGVGVGAGGGVGMGVQEMNDGLADDLLRQLVAHVQFVLAALGNYSVAFEALDGMRDQIEIALEAVRLPMQ